MRRKKELAAANLKARIIKDWSYGNKIGEVFETRPKATVGLRRDAEVEVYVAGKGGWAYFQRPQLNVGAKVLAPKSLNLRSAPQGGQVDGDGNNKPDTVAKGQSVIILDKTARGDWVKIVVAD